MERTKIKTLLLSSSSKNPLGLDRKAKMLAVWEAAERGKYSHILCIDSDAILTGNESLGNYFRDGYRNVIFGSSSIINFFSNAHWDRETLFRCISIASL